MMTSKKQIWAVWAAIAGLVLAALFNHDGLAIHIVIAVVWVCNLLTSLLAGSAALLLFTEGELRKQLKDALRNFITAADEAAPHKYLSWGLKLLVVMTLAFSGWVITLVCYLLAVVIYSILRNQLVEPAAA